MTSIFTHTKSKVTVHILHDDTLTDDNRQRFIRTAEKYSQGLELVDISEHKEKLTRITTEFGHWGIGTMFRLLIQDVIHTDKVIYFDCDVLVNIDIKEMWDIDFEGKTLAAAHSVLYFWKISPLSFRGQLLRLLGTDTQHYFSAGVLLMNLRKLRGRGDFLEELREWFARKQHLALFPDQDALNSIFVHDVKYIDPKFHVYELNGDLSNSVVHMFMSKPWKAFKGLKSELLYWNMYLRSAWGEGTTPEGLLTILCNIKNSEANSHSRKDRIKNILRQMWHMLVSCKGFCKGIGLTVKDVYYRLARR